MVSGTQERWERHFVAHTPAYKQASVARLTLRPSEQQGTPPGSAVSGRATGVEGPHLEITGKGYKSLRPRIETTIYNANCARAVGPYGNHIRFAEDPGTGNARGTSS